MNGNARPARCRFRPPNHSLAALSAAVAMWVALASRISAADSDPSPASRARRVLYNLDGDSCLVTRANSKGPVALNVDDLKRLVEEGWPTIPTGDWGPNSTGAAGRWTSRGRKFASTRWR
jgi:hypothetical protein